jgi:hypothetical protein
MASSAFTKKSRTLLWTWRIIDWICLFLPLIVYVVIGLASGNVTTSAKVGLVGMLFLALVFTCINVIAQKNLRAPIWCLLLGIYIAMDKWLLPLIVILAVTSILDDVLFSPIIHYYYTQTVASKTIDKREAAEDASIVNNNSND